MTGWGAIQYVGSGLSLVAFIVAAFLYAYTARLRQRGKLIESAPPEMRLEAIATTAEFFRVDVSRLSPKQQKEIVLREIEARARRDLLGAGIAIVVAILLALVAIVGMRSTTPDPVRASVSWGPRAGGDGGVPFGPSTCRSGEVLVGLYGKDKDPGPSAPGPFVFSIGSICAPIQFKGGILRASSMTLGAPNRGDEFGSGKGLPFELTCPAKTVVVGSEFEHAAINVTDLQGKPATATYLVDHLVLRCSGVLHGGNRSAVQKISRPGSPLSFLKTTAPFQCPEGSAGFGIKGQSGNWIDALSIGCRYV